MFRKAQNHYLKKVGTSITFQKVLNIGAIPSDKDKEGALYTNYFPSAEFFTLDNNQSYDSPNHLRIDLHECSNLKHNFDLVLLMSVLEHVKNPFKVAEQITEIVASKGYLYLSLPFFYPIHKNVEGGYSRYWRFTDDTIPILFEEFNIVWTNEIPSALRRVQDRDRYWENQLTVMSYCVLLQKKN